MVYLEQAIAAPCCGLAMPAAASLSLMMVLLVRGGVLLPHYLSDILWIHVEMWVLVAELPERFVQIASLENRLVKDLGEQGLLKLFRPFCSDLVGDDAAVMGSLPEGRELALYNVNGEFYATENFCPHKGAPLAAGTLCEYTIECDWHRWQFDVRTGECLTMTEKLRTYEVVVEEGSVKILI